MAAMEKKKGKNIIRGIIPFISISSIQKSIKMKSKLPIKIIASACHAFFKVFIYGVKILFTLSLIYNIAHFPQKTNTPNKLEFIFFGICINFISFVVEIVSLPWEFPRFFLLRNYLFPSGSPRVQY